MADFVPVTPEEVNPRWVEHLIKGLLAPKPVNMRVLSVNFTPATRPGDNFGSQIVRFNVFLVNNGRAQQWKMIGKFLPKSKPMREMLTAGGIFQREAEAYINWAGAMLDVPTKSGTQLQPPLPRIFCGSYGSRGAVIMLEDLRASGFKMVDKLAGLNDKETHLCLDALAKLHALSYSVSSNSREPAEERFPNLIHLHADESEDAMARTNGLIGCMAELLEVTHGQEGSLKSFQAYMKGHNPASRMKFLSDAGHIPLKMILHGDCWTNNIMFRFDKSIDGGEEEPIEVKFVDLQAPRYSHPAVDIGYFLFTSVPGILRRHRMKDLLNFYYDRLFEYLDDLMVTDITPDTYPFQDFWKDFRHFAELSFLNSCLVLPFIFGQQSDIPDIRADFCLDTVLEKRRNQMRSCSGTDLARWALDLVHDAVDLEIL